jgi:hypothetical protein
MATLFNTKIKDTYQSLLKLEDNTILTTTTKNVTDGLGNASPLYMSTTRIGVGTNAPVSTLNVLGLSTFIGASGNTLGSTTANAAAQFYQNGFNGVLAIGGYSNGGGEIQSYQGGGANAAGSMFLQRQAGNVLIGSASDTAKLSVKGSGSTSATTSLLVQNSSSNTLLQVLDNGLVYVGTANTGLSFSGSNTQIFNNGGSGGRISFAMGGVSYIEIYQPINNGGGFTSGTLNNISTPFTYTNTSGAVSYNLLSISPGINNTGTYTGTIRGIYYNPSLTSLVGTTHIALETVTGNVLLGTTSGNVGIRTSSPTNPLDIAYSPGRLISFKARTGYADYGQIVFSSVTGAEIISSGSIDFGPGNTNLTVTLGNGLTSKITTPGSTKYDGFGNQTPSTLAGATNQPVLFTSTIPDGNIDGFIFENTSSGSRNLFKLIQNNTTLLTVNPNGNTLIGTTTDSGYKLNVNGTTFVSALITTGGIVKHNPYTPGIRALEVYSGTGHGGNTGVWSSMYQVGVYGNGWDGYYQTQGIGVQGDPNNNSLGGSVVNLGVYGGAALSNATGIYGTSGLFGKATNLRNASAALEVNSTTHGFLPPRMTAAQRTSVTTITGFGTITGGSGYVDGTYYTVSITGGSGQNAYARIIVSGGSVTSVTLESSLGGLTGGFGYTNGASVSASNTQLGGTGAGFSVIANASTPVGMMVYQTDMVEGLYIYKSTGWTFII